MICNRKILKGIEVMIRRKFISLMTEPRATGVVGAKIITTATSEPSGSRRAQNVDE